MVLSGQPNPDMTENLPPGCRPLRAPSRTCALPFPGRVCSFQGLRRGLCGSSKMFLTREPLNSVRVRPGLAAKVGYDSSHLAVSRTKLRKTLNPDENSDERSGIRTLFWEVL